MANTELFSSKI